MMRIRGVGDRIRDLRKAQGLSMKALARRARIGRITLLRIEQGTQDPRLGTLEGIARALGVTLRDLFPEKGERRATR